MGLEIGLARVFSPFIRIGTNLVEWLAALNTPTLLVGAIFTGGAGGGFTILMVNDDQEPILAHTEPLSTAMYLVLTV